MSDLWMDGVHTFYELGIFCLQLFKQLDTMIKEGWRWLELLLISQTLKESVRLLTSSEY
jgi:hypothetical protein